MKHKNVVIRSKEHVDLLDPRIRKAFRDAGKGAYPVYYTYCQEKTPQLQDTPENFIGKATNIHENSDGDIVCDVITNDALTATGNFQGVIDNFFISIVPDKNGNAIPTLKQLVIYNKDFKAEVDARRSEISAGRSKEAPVEGDIPEPRVGANPVTKEVVKEMEKIAEAELGIKQPDANK